MKIAFRWFIFSVSHVEDFHGRAGRVEVWSFVFFQCIFLALAAGIDLLFTGFPIVLPIYAALTSIPSVLLFIRRLHDVKYVAKAPPTMATEVKIATVFFCENPAFRSLW